MNPVYLDYNATTPVDPSVAEAMLPYIYEHFGNPSSGHLYGRNANEGVNAARNQVAEMLGCRADELIFTSGGTESNNYAIKGAVAANRSRGDHMITSAVEHPAVIEVCKFLEAQGYRVTYLPVDQYGMVDPRQVEEAITPQTTLISIMHANNEVGTIEPIEEISEIAHRHGVLLHADCAQSVGKIPARVDDLGVDLLSIAGHKLYAPKGIGALYIRDGISLEKQMHGAGHEGDWRAGTENVIHMAALGRACELIQHNLPQYQRHMASMRGRLEAGLTAVFGEIRINGHPSKRLPNTSSVSFRRVEANTVLAEMEDLAASAGAACHSDRVEVSSVLEAMGIPLEYAMGTLRFSVGRFTTGEEIDRAVAEVARVVSPHLETAAVG